MSLELEGAIAISCWMEFGTKKLTVDSTVKRFVWHGSVLKRSPFCL